MNATIKSPLYAVILAGGSGIRLWPLSRRNKPKHQLEIIGNQSLLQQTYNRLHPAFKPENILVVTTCDQEDNIRAQLPTLPFKNLLVEPVGKNTAASIGLAAIVIHRRSKDAIMAALPADHLIRPRGRFLEALGFAAYVASCYECPITFGIKPSFPSTNYGYLGRGKLVLEDGKFHLFQCDDFTEKPDKETAQKFLETERYYWNSGIFVWKAGAALNALRRFMPTLSRALEKVSSALDTPSEAQALHQAYQGLESVSIDHGVMEKTRDIKVIEADFEWIDIGDWSIFGEFYGERRGTNIVIGKHYSIDTSNCISIASSENLLVTAGVKDLIIIQTPDVTLVCHKDKTGEIKRLVRELGESGLERYL